VLVRAGVSTQFKSFPPIRVFAVVIKFVANHVTVVGLADTGHWVMEERPKEMMDAVHSNMIAHLALVG
jgi:pimeloyl-ACP methyl ester carboxylesterase